MAGVWEKWREKEVRRRLLLLLLLLPPPVVLKVAVFPPAEVKRESARREDSLTAFGRG